MGQDKRNPDSSSEAGRGSPVRQSRSADATSRTRPPGRLSDLSCLRMTEAEIHRPGRLVEKDKGKEANGFAPGRRAGVGTRSRRSGSCCLVLTVQSTVAGQQQVQAEATGCRRKGRGGWIESAETQDGEPRAGSERNNMRTHDPSGGRWPLSLCGRDQATRGIRNREQKSPRKTIQERRGCGGQVRQREGWHNKTEYQEEAHKKWCERLRGWPAQRAERQVKRDSGKERNKKAQTRRRKGKEN